MTLGCIWIVSESTAGLFPGVILCFQKLLKQQYAYLGYSRKSRLHVGWFCTWKQFNRKSASPFTHQNQKMLEEMGILLTLLFKIVTCGTINIPSSE